MASTPIDRDSALDRLYAAAPADFVAERKRLARELREGGDRQGAAEIAKWPKPSPVAWALNAAARDDDERLGDWLAAAGALREASASPGDGDALRAAMAAHRTATAGLLKAVAERSPLSAAMLDRVRALLQAATADAALAGAIQAGRVDEGRGEDAPAGTSPGGGAGTREATPAREGKGRDKKKDKDKGSGEVDVEHEAELERQAEQERQAELERQAEEERQAELDRQIAAASATLDERREESDAAKDSVTAAEERVEEAERTLRRSRSEASAARATAKEAGRALADAERLLDTLRSRRSA